HPGPLGRGQSRSEQLRRSLQFGGRLPERGEIRPGSRRVPEMPSSRFRRQAGQGISRDERGFFRLYLEERLRAGRRAFQSHPRVKSPKPERELLPGKVLSSVEKNRGGRSRL